MSGNHKAAGLRPRGESAMVEAMAATWRRLRWLAGGVGAVLLGPAVSPTSLA